MKANTTKLLLLFVVLSLNFTNLFSQITKTVGGSGANYSTLKLAFDAINTGSITGAITLQITGSTTETESAVLYNSGYSYLNKTSNYSSVNIYPTVSSVSVSGNFSAPIIYLNGADNVTIDGRINMIGGNKDLSLKNSNTTAGGVTIRYVNSSESNIIRYCNIMGSCNNSGTGIIYFTGSSTGNGNSNNLIEYCNITSANGNRPVNAIFTSGTIGHENKNNTIRKNNIYNVLNNNSISNGILISYASTDWIISNNSFYETQAISPSGANKYYFVYINTGENMLIDSNYFGGTAPLCSGSPLIIGSNFAHYFTSIFINGGTVTKSIVSNNFIQNLNYTSTEDNPWDGIYINSGDVDVIGNTIGSPTGNNSIVVNTPVAYATATINNGVVKSINIVGGGSGYTVPPTITFSTNNGGTGVSAEAQISNGVITEIELNNGGSGYTSAPSVYFDGQSNMYSTSHGMIQNSSGTVNINNNNIGGITTYGTSTYSHGWETVYVRTVTGVTTFDGNLIGSLTTANSIQTGSNAVNSLLKQDVYGIYSSSVGSTIIKNNTISNLTNNYTGSNTGSKTRGIQTISGNNTIQNNTVQNLISYSAQSSSRSNATTIGISQTSTTAGTIQIVSDNFVNNIKSINSTPKVDVYGILFLGPTTGKSYVFDNFVHSISATSTNTSSEIDGIILSYGNTNCYNNIVNLGTGISTGYKFSGIVDDGGSNNNNSIYFNSVYIAGTVSGATSSTFALLNNATNTSRVYENNIFENARSGGSTGKHYSIYLPGNSGLIINYNNYFVSGTNSVLMNYASADKTILNDIKLATGQDLNSSNTNPLFMLAGGTNPFNYYSVAGLNGISISGITTDYDDLIRKNTPKIGALENNNYVWQGNISTDFGTAGNWVGGTVPPNGADIAFSATPNRNCVLDQNRSFGDITNAQSTYKFVLNGKQLTLTGNLIFSNNAQIDATTASSTVSFSGSAAQSIPAGSFVNNSIDTLKINNSHGFSLNSDFTVQRGIGLQSGNFSIGSNTLTFNGVVTDMNGSVTGGSTSNMIIGGSGSVINMPDFTLNNLTINRAGGVSLYGNLHIIGTLTLSNGTLTLNSNTLTLSGNSPVRTTGNMDAGNLTANLVFENSSAITLPTSIFVNPVNNLTISGAGGITSSSDFSINGILSLQSTNPSSTKGILDMGTNTLTMGANSTTIGVGDVTGIVKRNSFVPTVAYTFGNQFTTMTFSAGGTLPTDVSVKIKIGTSPTWKSSAIQRYYDIKRTGGLNTSVTLALHYLQSELQSNNEANLIIWDYHASVPKVEEHGKSNQNFTDEWVSISNRNITYFDTTFDTHQWGISNKESVNFMWQGTPSTDWNEPNNWSTGVIPTATSDVVIPDATTTVHSPTLASTATVKTIVIQPNGILNGGNSTSLTVAGSSGAWFNMGEFVAGTSNVIFTNANATMADPTNFYNVIIANGASLTLGTDNIMRIAGELILQGTGILRAALLPNTVEFNGINQNIINANGLTQGFYNLILSGSGVKTMPDTELKIANNLTVSGTTTAVADSIIDIHGNLIVNEGATFDLNDYNHYFSGDIVCDGNLITSPNTGSVTLNGENLQSLDGIKNTDIEFNNLILANPNGVVVNKDVKVKNDLTVNSNSYMTINPSLVVNVEGNIINNAGSSGLVVKTNNSNVNGTLIFHNSSNSPVNATVEMYSKANWNLNNPTGSKYEWQYFGIPLKSMNYNSVFANCYVRKWNETGKNDYDIWNMMQTNSTLNSFYGYELVQSSPTYYNFKGELENRDFVQHLTKTSGAQFSGQHILANPFTAAIDISKIEFDSELEASIYLYNTGSYTSWVENGGISTPGNNPGQYIVSTKNTAGYGGIPGQIPSMQGFLVKVLNDAGTITIPYSSVISNNDQLRIKAQNNAINVSKVYTKIELKDSKSSDFLWIFSNPMCNRSFDNGWDGFKFISETGSPQIFAVEPDGNYQIDAISDINNTNIGIIGSQETKYELSFEHYNIDNKYNKIYLVDALENKTIDITQNGSTYSFTNYSNSNFINRFKIVTHSDSDQSIENILNLQQKTNEIIVSNYSNDSGTLAIYNLSGTLVDKINFDKNSLSTISTSLISKGIYIVKAQTINNKVVSKFLIH